MPRKNTLLHGRHEDIVNTNIQTLKNAGYHHTRAVKTALSHANLTRGTKIKRIQNKIIKPNLNIRMT